MSGEIFSLPDGWVSEERDSGASLIIERPGVGAVTVDFHRRTFSGGYGTRVYGGGYGVYAAHKYTGRGWRDRLIADAVKWLGAL